MIKGKRMIRRRNPNVWNVNDWEENLYIFYGFMRFPGWKRGKRVNLGVRLM
jgi:hypothetical protein